MNLMDIESYPYPESGYEYEGVDTTLEKVRAGDRHCDYEVATNKTGTKWTELRDKDGTLITRSPKDDMVRVLRQVETPESRHANERVGANRAICRRLTKDWEANVLVALERITMDVKQYGYADYSPLDSFLGAQAHSRVMRRFISLVEIKQEKLDAGEWEGDLVDVRDLFAKQVTKELVAAYANRARSRSTGVVSNLLDDCNREALAWWLEEFENAW